MKKQNVIIIGGGAAGMTAAIVAARQSADVCILEHTGRVGKKILATGNGRCNLTNLAQHTTNYRSTQEGFAWEVIKLFNTQQTLRFFTEIGLYTKNKNGYIYPYSEQASAVLDVLRMECRRLNITIQLNTNIHTIKKQKNRFYIKTDQGDVICDSVILASGSKASPKTGSDGSGYELAKAFGHTIQKPLPTLVALQSKGGFFKALAGVRCDARLTLIVQDKIAITERGELQLTNYGISGIPTFQISHDAVKALDDKKPVRVQIDFMPELVMELFETFFQQRLSQSKDKTIEEMFIGLLHKKIVGVLLKQAKISRELPCSKLRSEQRAELLKQIKRFEIPILGSNSFEQAQACQGGVDTREIHLTMESKLVKNLYFAGEIVDVDGKCGGYNLQWAWSSGMIAGKEAAKQKA